MQSLCEPKDMIARDIVRTIIILFLLLDIYMCNFSILFVLIPFINILINEFVENKLIFYLYYNLRIFFLLLLVLKYYVKSFWKYYV